MPIIPKSTYLGAPLTQITGHLQTIIPSKKKGAAVNFQRQRILTPDDDFLDIDRLDNEGKNLLILTHGLEGNSGRPYMRNSAKWFHDRGWDVISWNCRTCSGEMNKQPRMYSHGEIEDIGFIIERALNEKAYENIALVGFSMGGNILMKYLGVHGKTAPKAVKAGVAFSSPADLYSSTMRLEEWDNFLYNKRFLAKLESKIKVKAEMFPDLIDVNDFKKVKSWNDFMELFYAPLHNCSSVEEFYHYASARNFIEGTDRPILLVNAKNDPMLTPACSPVDIAKKHPLFYLEQPKKGGHVGFALRGKEHSWMEMRAWNFVQDVLQQKIATT